MDWKEILNQERVKPYYLKLKEFVDNEYEHYRVFPPKQKIYRALSLTPFSSVKVVILGQDPYHNPEQAMGLAFSVPNGVDLPPSLLNIFKEIENEYGKTMIRSGDLTYLAKQGVLLLNTVLSVRMNQPLSHQNRGYEILTDTLISKLNEDDNPKVFLLWGSKAISKRELITNPHHLILTSPHPSPLSASRGFFGNGHFIKCNEFLVKNGLEPINWINH